MSFIVRIACLLLLLMTTPSAWALDAGRDSHAINDQETKTFIALICEEPFFKEHNFSCAKIVGRPDVEWSPTDDYISFTTIAYGDFTRAGADQAYVSYLASFEGAATNMGGGILFERSGNLWKLVRWYPGLAMNDCLAIPDATPQKMLCLSGFYNMGEAISTLGVFSVPASNDEKSTQGAWQNLLEADDASSSPAVNQNCKTKRASDQAIPVSVDHLRRSQDAHSFAEADIAYVLPADIAAACKIRHFEKAKQSKSTIEMKVENGDVSIAPPVPMVMLQR